jgi:CDP-glucose 4,6-dehydratase
MEMPLGQRLRELSGPLLLTGHTGFKGTWMTFLLEHLSVPVVGYSLPAEKNSLFDRAERTGAIPEEFSDIRDYEALERFMDRHKPSTIIHMAAQPLVLKSYESPRETFNVNVMGTVNVLDIAFKKEFVKSIIVVTTDKVYRNDNSGRAFIETDPLEGKDPYSASKVGTEAVVAAWQQIARVSGGPVLVSVRAGNVIGGGDFAENRILPDLIRAIFLGEELEIRNPSSTRPWQFVLDPLRGYLMALEKSLWDLESHCYNFSTLEPSLSVGELIDEVEMLLGRKIRNLLYGEKSSLSISNQGAEAHSLELDSKFAQQNLTWRPFYNQKHAVNATITWWDLYYSKMKNIDELCSKTIVEWLDSSS